MNAFRQKRTWFWIAVAAIVVALVAFSIPHGHGSAAQPDWLALLPVFFVGLISSLELQPLIEVLRLGHAPEAPALAPSFQRPPPSLA